MIRYFSRIAAVAALSVAPFGAAAFSSGAWTVVRSEKQTSFLTRGDTLQLWAAGDLMVVDTSVRACRNMSLEFTVVPENEKSHIGALVRYVSPDDWIYVGCDLTTDIFGYCYWYVETPQGRKQVATDIAKLYKNYPRRIQVDCGDEAILLRVDGEKVAHFALPWRGYDRPGRVGFRVWDGGAAKIYDVEVVDNGPAGGEGMVRMDEEVAARSHKLSVSLVRGFPVDYSWHRNGGMSSGNWSSPFWIINGKRYRAEDLVQDDVRVDDSTYTYKYGFPQIGIEIDVENSVRGNVYEWRVTDIREKGDFRVRTIGLGDNMLIAMPNADTTARLSVAWNEGGDGFWKLSERTKTDTVPVPAAIAILNNDKVAVASDNNSQYESKQFLIRNRSERTSIGSNEWIYRGPDGKVTELPYQKVIFADDINGDGKVTWQDGAVALAEVYPDPYGAEMVRNSNVTITMNFASEGQYPFLRQLDNIKKIYYLTDGFGQMLELKGYQSEGHDSGHPDYAGHYNERAGGLKDLRVLIDEAKKYNAHIGFHINHSESYPEARAFDDTIVTRIPGWKWLDQAYLINKEADHLNGSFAKRLNDLHRDLPGLAFIYLDTYREHRYWAYRTAKMFNERGWTVWTEDPSVFNRYGTWIHYNPESNSLISRFVHNHRKDAFGADSLFPGGYGRGADVGFQGWQSGRDMNLAIKNFYTKQLPLRYVMHFPVIYADSVAARFRGGVETRRAAGVTTMYRDERKVMDGEVVFIPWNPLTEEKVYHYNPAGGVTEWEVPESWEEVRAAYLYRLTDRGRVAVGRVAVKEGRVSLTAEAGVPYVLYRDTPPKLLPADWSRGSAVRDMGFDSRSFGWWKPIGARKGVGFETTLYGQSVLKLTGRKACGAAQEIAGLDPEKYYHLSVWVQVDGEREASMRAVTPSGGRAVSVRRTDIPTFVENTDKKGTRYQRLEMRLHGVEAFSLVLCAGKSVSDTTAVRFDDVRLMEVSTPTSGSLAAQAEGYLYYEDFERVPFGWGPFMLSRPSNCTSHLSKRHDPYTAGDVINGDWSFKTLNEGGGEILRTMPSLLSFSPNTGYAVEFEYDAPVAGVYRGVVRSAKTGRTLVSEPLDGRGRFAAEFVTDGADDYYFSVVKAGEGMLVIDDFGVRKTGK